MSGSLVCDPTFFLCSLVLVFVLSVFGVLFFPLFFIGSFWLVVRKNVQ